MFAAAAAKAAANGHAPYTLLETSWRMGLHVVVSELCGNEVVNSLSITCDEKHCYDPFGCFSLPRKGISSSVQVI